MKLGFSNLLGEFLQAEALDYADSKNFQVVCPSCREPVFKVVRKDHERTIHYLSHYEKDAAYVANCELRVESITKDTVAKINDGSKGQRLAYFLSVLPEATNRALYLADEKASKARAFFFKKLKKCRAIQKSRDSTSRQWREIIHKMSDDVLMSLFTAFVDFTTDKEGGFYQTSFAVEKQKRIALDMYRHVYSLKAKPTFDFLFDHAYMEVITKLTEDSKHRELSKVESDLRNIMVNILNMGKEDGLRLLASLSNYAVGSEESAIDGYDMYKKLNSEIEHEIIGILIRLPYFELLKEAGQQKKHYML